MAFGLFGKIPQKRDFVSVDLPHQVLHPLETWLQSAVAASRNDIGRGWEDWYLVAPIWHFWLGRDVFGVPCAGSVMPSVDQVGRYFPFAVVYVAEAGEMLPPPLLDPMGDWFAHIDQRMLTVLAEERDVDLHAILAGLSRPQPSPPPRVVVELAMPAIAAPPPSPTPPPAVPPAMPAADPPAATNGNGAPKASAWDLPSMSDDALASVRQATGQRVEPPGGTIPPVALPAVDDADGSPWDAPAGAAPPIEDAPAEPVSEASPPTVPAADLPPPPQAPVPPPLPRPARIQVGDFRGGLLAAVEPHRLIIEAAGDLLNQDYRHASAARSYWWCERTANGSPLLHARQGMPDPFFFSRMLMFVK